MPNKWITHVKKYHSDHPELNYKQAMQQAKKTYKKGTQQGEGFFFKSAKIKPVVDRDDQRYRDRQRRQSLLKSGLSDDTSKPTNAISAPVFNHNERLRTILTQSGLL